MDNNLFSLFLSAIVGFSTLLGGLIVLFNKKKNDRNIVLILGISIGILAIVGLQELIPESLNILTDKLNIIYSILIIICFIFIGYFITHLLDKLFHHENDNLKHLGLITTLAVSMHKIPEGMALYITSYENPKLGILVALGIMLHHIPEGIMIAMPIYYSTNSKLKAIKYAFLSSLAPIIGTLIAMIFLNNFINTYVLGILFSITTGMFIFIITHELIPTAISYKKNNELIYSILTGMTIMMIIHLFIK